MVVRSIRQRDLGFICNSRKALEQLPPSASQTHPGNKMAGQSNQHRSAGKSRHCQPLQSPETTTAPLVGTRQKDERWQDA